MIANQRTDGRTVAVLLSPPVPCRVGGDVTGGVAVSS